MVIEKRVVFLEKADRSVHRTVEGSRFGIFFLWNENGRRFRAWYTLNSAFTMSYLDSRFKPGEPAVLWFEAGGTKALGFVGAEPFMVACPGDVPVPQEVPRPSRFGGAPSKPQEAHTPAKCLRVAADHPVSVGLPVAAGVCRDQAGYAERTKPPIDVMPPRPGVWYTIHVGGAEVRFPVQHAPSPPPVIIPKGPCKVCGFQPLHSCELAWEGPVCTDRKGCQIRTLNRTIGKPPSKYARPTCVVCKYSTDKPGALLIRNGAFRCNLSSECQDRAAARAGWL